MQILLMARAYNSLTQRVHAELADRVGAREAARLTQARLPVTPASALSCGLIDKVIAGGTVEYRAQATTLAAQLAHSPGYPARLAAKARQLAEAENTGRWPPTALPS
jgi:hypothetical protein